MTAKSGFRRHGALLRLLKEVLAYGVLIPAGVVVAAPFIFLILSALKPER